MLITIVTTGKNTHYIYLPDINEERNFTRSLLSTTEKGNFLTLLPKNSVRIKTKEGLIASNDDIYLNIREIESVLVDKSSKYEEKTPLIEDNSHLNAAKSIVKLEGKELESAQLNKQPLKADIDAANEREEKLRKQQGVR